MICGNGEVAELGLMRRPALDNLNFVNKYGYKF